MMRAIEKLDKKHKPQVSQEEWDKAQEMLKSVTAHDPKVRLN